VDGDEGWGGVAEDHGLLRAPGMRVLMLKPAARDQYAGLLERRDHRLVGIALLAGVGEHALAGEARCVIGERAVLVDGVGNDGVDAALFERGLVGSPHLEVLAAVAGGGMHEAGAGIVGDVVAGEQRNAKGVVAAKAFKRMLAF